MAKGKCYKNVELVGTSTESIEEAIDTALERANKTLKNLNWFEVKEIRGWIKDGKVGHYQVVTKFGFRLEDDDDDD